MPNLYVTEQGARVEREYDRIVVSKNREVLLDVPAIKVSDVVLVGRVGVTTPALQMLLERDIGRRTTYQRLLEYQARRLVAVIEGREDAYEPFRSR